MNSLTLIPHSCAGTCNETRSRGMTAELGLFGALLLALNLPMLCGIANDALVLNPERVVAGEWWRWFSFSWVHLSWYHLLLDGAAFLLLYSGLRSTRGMRLAQVALCLGLSGLFPWFLAPEISAIGLCGLSGAAHGLMMLSGLEMTRDSDRLMRRIGWIMVLGVAVKALGEQFSGAGALANWHPGFVGTPIPSCHLGGVVGGLLGWAASLRFTAPTSRNAGDFQET